MSWIRRRDWQILSSGNSAFTKDARFQLHHRHASQEWTLLVKYLQKRDEGTYVCQVINQRIRKIYYLHGYSYFPLVTDEKEKTVEVLKASLEYIHNIPTM